MTDPLALNARLAALVVFAVAALSLRMQFDATVATVPGGSPLAALWLLAGYFTVLTNLLVSLMLAAVILRARVPAVVLLTMTLSIVMVGLVYHLLLAGLTDPKGPAWWADQGLHTATPILTLIWWLIFAPRPTGSGALIKALIWPLLYLIYAVCRGSVTGFWPYPFLNATDLGWARTGLNCAGMVVAFLAVGAALVAVKRRLG